MQFAGFTFGKAVSQFDTPWSGSPGNITSNLIGGYDDFTGINQVSYTAQFGNGVSASISLEDPSSYTQGGLYNVDAVASASTNAGGLVSGPTVSGINYLAGIPGLNSYAGVQVPDIVGQIRVDQAWGLFQVSAAAHQLRASYYTAAGSGTLNETLGHPEDKWGYAVQGALSLKNIPTGAGDSFNMSATYANGASRYVIGGTTGNNFAMYGSSSSNYQSIALGFVGDGVFGNGGSIETSSIWGVRGAFNHNWTPNWATSVFGSYTSVDWNGNATALICGATRVTANVSYNGVCNPDFNIAQIGTVTRWTPVKNLTFSGEVLYTYLDQRSTGTISGSASNTKLGGQTYELKDQGTFTGAVRVQRTF